MRPEELTCDHPSEMRKPSVSKDSSLSISFLDGSTSLRICVVASHSGGHLFPAYSFAKEFVKAYPQAKVYLLTTKKGHRFSRRFEEGIFSGFQFQCDYRSAPKNTWERFLFLMQLPQAFFSSFCFLVKIRPELCLGFGGFVSLFPLWLSRWMGIPTFIHEQNRLPGKASRWLAGTVDCVCDSFPDTRWQSTPRTLVTTGLPVRYSVSNSHKASKVGQPIQLLIFGGSQGAHTLNRLVMAAMAGLSREERGKIAVNHIAGDTDYEWIVSMYDELGIRASVWKFFELMGDLYEQADMAVTRAGANTLFELALFKVPAIVIPYPYAEAHQFENASFFAQANAIVLKEERGLAGKGLLEDIRNLWRDNALRERLSANIGTLADGDASEKLVRFVVHRLKKVRS